MTNNSKQSIKPKQIVSKNGINVYKIDTTKFKTNQINIFFHDNLEKESVAYNALLASVLRRGTRKLQTTKELSIYLEELYGAVFDCAVGKRGEIHLMHFFSEFISDEFSKVNESVFEKAFDYMHDIIFDPKVVDGGFDKEFVEQEKKNIINIIESKINDKQSYSVLKCIEEMCADERYGIYELGEVDYYNSIDEKNLYQYYQEFIKDSPISVFISGNISEDEINRVIDKLFKVERKKIKEIKKSMVNIKVDEVKDITEKMAVNQGKLTLGYRTYVEAGTLEYYSLIVCNSILGGGIHSKLFQNVREKEGLAYYAFSRVDKFKGLMILSCGIESKNRQKVIDIMNEQINDIIQGKISDYEYDVSLKVIESSINSIRDSQYQIMDFGLSQSIIGTNEDLDSIIEKCKNVTREDISEVAKKLKLDTIYFLTNA
jgi:predicted Zn-dependent peptidase